MNQGKYVFAQLMSLIPRHEFQKCVTRYQGDHRVRNFGCWQHFLCMVFGQLAYRDSLRDIVICLSARQKRLYHLGLGQKIARSTLSDANQRRNWRIYADFAQVLMKQVVASNHDDNEQLAHIPHSILALDASLIRLCVNVFFWAKYRKTTAAVKIHTLLDVRTMLPHFVAITEGKLHDQQMMKELDLVPQALYVMDRGYVDFKQLYRIHLAEAFFVVRAKKSLQFSRHASRKRQDQDHIIFDQEGSLKVLKSKKLYPKKLRLIKAVDPETGKYIRLLTNNFKLSASDIALIYRYRWRIELFFKWIKQHLNIKVFWGESENAVKIQIYTALCAYLILALTKQKLDSPQSLYEIAQILSTNLFDKTPVSQLLTTSPPHDSKNEPGKQLTIC